MIWGRNVDPSHEWNASDGELLDASDLEVLSKFSPSPHNSAFEVRNPPEVWKFRKMGEVSPEIASSYGETNGLSYLLNHGMPRDQMEAQSGPIWGPQRPPLWLELLRARWHHDHSVQPHQWSGPAVSPSKVDRLWENTVMGINSGLGSHGKWWTSTIPCW